MPEPPADTDLDADSSPAGDDEPGAPRATLDRAEEDALLVELNALLGRGTSYEGKLHFEGRVRIEGSFEGEIQSQDVLVIGQGAKVKAEINVGACIITGGRVHANIRARDAIELHVPAIVKGDLHAPNIFIDRGVQFEGKCHMAPLDAASSDDADSEPQGSMADESDPGDLATANDDAAAQDEAPNEDDEAVDNDQDPSGGDDEA